MLGESRCFTISKFAAHQSYRYLGPVPHDTSYYAKCMLGGILACGITHAGITPLDVAKCNMQVRFNQMCTTRTCPTNNIETGEPRQVQLPRRCP